MAKLTSKPLINLINPSQTAPPFALLAADSFYEISNRFFSQCLDKKKSSNLAVRNPGLLISSATNLCLSVELYLKGILLQTGFAIPRTHNLLELFKLLPQGIVQDLKSKYDSLKPQEGSLKTVELELFIDKTPNIPGSEKDDIPKDKSIEGVLDRASDASMVWQSAFEVLNKKNASIAIEFGYLKAIALALKTVYRVNLNEKK